MEPQEETSEVSTRDVGIRYGLYSAGIAIVLFLVPALIGQNPFQGVWNWIGVPVTIALFVFGHKYFKDEGDGFMSFGQGVGIGFWISLIGTVLGGGFVYVYITFIDPVPFDLFLEETRFNMEEQGTPEEGIEMAMTWTKNLFWPIYAVAGIVGGVVLAMIVSIFTQKKTAEQTY